MFKVINIDGKEVPMVANAATAIRYQQVFRKDLLKTMDSSDEIESMVMIQELAYIMASSGAKADMNRLNHDTYVEWLEGFEAMAFMDEDTAMGILELWRGNRETSTTAKKKQEQPNEK